MTTGIRNRAVVLLLAFWLFTNFAQRATANPSPFYMGGDVSLISFMQGQFPTAAQPRARFVDNGVEAPMEKIMYDRGANLFRLRIFVNPQVNYTNGNSGAIQTQAYDIALAQQIKTNCPNAKIVLDFHYSDTWADPGRQNLPAAWATPPQTLEQLKTTVQNYTQTTLEAFKSAGVMPDIVQLGNETTGGTMWPTGKLNFYDSSDNNPSKADQNASWAAYGGLWNAAIAGVRAVQDPGQRIPIALSIDRGDRDGQPQYHYGFMQASTSVPDANGFTGGGVTDFDIMGVDFYPTATNLITTMQSNLTTLANTNYSNFVADVAANPDTHLPLKRIMLLENNYPWRNSSVGSSLWPKTPDGQKAEFQAVRNLIYNLPHDVGLGVLWWYPEAVTVSGFNIYNGGATALFDSTTGSNIHNGLPALDVLQVGDYNRDGVVDAADYTVWRDTLGSTTDLRANGVNSHGSTAVIDLADYNYWVEYFSGGPGPGSGSATTVPEPSISVLMASVVTMAIGGRRCRRWLRPEVER